MSSKEGTADGFTEKMGHACAEAMGAVYSVTVEEGPDRGRTFVVTDESPLPTIFGTSDACTAQFTDPLVSRRHFSAVVTTSGLRVTDLGSTNGTYVNGVRFEVAYLRGTELMQLGKSVLRVGEPTETRIAVPLEDRFGRMLGLSVTMRKLFPLCKMIAGSGMSVLLEGATGTGKEVLAESLHLESDRASKPYVVFDCTAVAPSLIESELFGHERGAFTGSLSTHRGVFERADGGTLFIDEIGDLPVSLQSRLLRVIERREFFRLGGERLLSVDVRIIAATRRDLDREVRLGRFRDDLYHRVAVCRIMLPLLRERRGDISFLANHFAMELGGPRTRLPPELLQQWEDAPWPGNVRELRNSVARRLALGDLLGVEADSESQSMPSDILPGSPPRLTSDPFARVLSLQLPLVDARQKIISEFEERYVDHVLQSNGGNVRRAAAAAGITRRHLQRVKAKTNIDD